MPTSGLPPLWRGDRATLTSLTPQPGQPSPAASHRPEPRSSLSLRAGPAFSGHVKAVPDGSLPPTTSTLPDIANWKAPQRRKRQLAERVHAATLDPSGRYESPFIAPHLKQPPPLRCPPIPRQRTPGVLNPTFRDDLFAKPSVLAARLEALPGLVADPAASLGTDATRSHGKPRRPLDVSNDRAVRTLDSWGRHHAAPVLRPEDDAVMPDVTPAEAEGEVSTFEADVREKQAFHRFLQHGAPSTVPAMVLRQFKSQLALESPLVARLRTVPLAVVEEHVAKVTKNSLLSHQFIAMLERMLGDAAFTAFDAHNLFRYFDVDCDGDVDQRELSCGFLQCLSRDGPWVTVLQRAQALARAPRQKDSRVLYMRRYELELLGDAVLRAAEEEGALPAADIAAARAAIAQHLATVGANRRGELSLDEARAVFRDTDVLRRAAESFTVPRERELYESELSAAFRQEPLPEELEQPFRLLTAEKLLMQRAAAAQKKRASMGPRGVVTFEECSHAGDSSDTDAEAPLLDVELRPAVAFSEASEFELSQIAAQVAQRPTPEPDNPTFFSHKGQVYRQVVGHPAVAWNPDMEQ